MPSLPSDGRCLYFVSGTSLRRVTDLKYSASFRRVDTYSRIFIHPVAPLYSVYMHSMILRRKRDRNRFVTSDDVASMLSEILCIV